MSIGFELTRHCNLRCVHCLRRDTKSRQEIEPNLFARILDEARAYGRPWIVFTGGEPTLHRHFWRLLEAVRQRDLPCRMITNGLTFSTLAGRLRPYMPWLRSVAFSLDGATEATHDRIRGRGAFKKVVLAIATARYLGWQPGVQMVVNRANRAEAALLPRLCHQLGVSFLHVSHAQPSPRLFAAGLQLSPAEWRELEEEMAPLAAAEGVVPPQMAIGRFGPGDIAPCQTLQNTSLNIDYRGRLTFCCQLSGTSDTEEDVIADLHDTPLVKAHGKLLAVVKSVVAERVDGFHRGTFGEREGFHCWYCQRRFGKLSWMHAYPHDPWARAGRRRGGTPRRPARLDAASVTCTNAGTDRDAEKRRG